jgi:hypothetical protein
MRIGDYVWLPHDHADMNTAVPFLKHSAIFISGIPFIKVEDFTLDVVKSIVTFRPRSLMGETIASYQKDVVPKFVDQIQEEFPELYAGLVEALPQYAIKEKNYVGRKALLCTVEAGEVQIGHKKWNWDKSQLTSIDETGILLGITNCNNSNAVLSLIIVPKRDAVVTITRNDQVTKWTEFLD